MEHRDQLLLTVASIIGLGIGGQWLSWRLRVPAILVLLTIGCLAGSVSGFINPDAIFGDLLQPIVSLYVIATFAAAELLHNEAGLVSVTVMGMILANQKKVDLHRIIEFKESLTVVLIGSLFILLSARVPLQQLQSLGWRGLAFAAALIVAVRPLSVWLSTIGSGLSQKERLFLGWFASPAFFPTM